MNPRETNEARHEIIAWPSGNTVNLSHPSVESIVLEDIAHGLAMTCRYGGHVPNFYSVAEHAVLVSRLLEAAGCTKKTCLAGLHHDDAEAYLGDIPSPLKPLLQPSYGLLTGMMDLSIQAALGLPSVSRQTTAKIKDQDDQAYYIEEYVLRGRQIEEYAHYATAFYPKALAPTEAEGLYLSRHWELV